MPFRPTLPITIAGFALAIGSSALGWWQLERMAEKQDLFDSFSDAPVLDFSRAVHSGLPFVRVRASGRYEDSWHVLIDNRILDGRAGVHAVSLFRPESGGAALVNRGWLPLPPDRQPLPDVPTPPGTVEISGILAETSDPGFRLGDGDDIQSLRGVQLVTYFDARSIASTIDEPVSDHILLLDMGNPTGFDGRAWKPAVMLPSQHRAYAFQWFALAAAVLAGWAFLGWHRGSQLSGPAAGSEGP